MKFILIPGYVDSIDGDTHFISGQQLAKLYNIRHKNYQVCTERTYIGTYVYGNCIVLTPRSDGNYFDFGNIESKGLNHAAVSLEQIYDICVDYDGQDSVKGLKNLIDEVKKIAYNSLKDSQ